MRRALTSRRGVAALEFALVAPTMVVFMIGVFDITKAVVLQQEVWNTAHTIPLSASNLAIQPDQTTTLTVTQVQQSLSAIFAEMPLVRAGVENGLKSATMSSVLFTQTDPTCNPKTTTCAYAPQVAWSVPYAGPPSNNAIVFQQVTRPCATNALVQVAPTAVVPGNFTQVGTLGIENPDPILLVDVHYRYSPLFLTFLTGPIDFWSTGYWPVRTGKVGTSEATQWTTYDLQNAAGGVGKCPNYLNPPS
jgi:Flp pilus assembly protein TadG